MELYAQLDLGLVERLARLEHERHAVPARRVHVEDGRREGLRRRLLVLDGLVLQVAWLFTRARVLADDEVVACQRLDRLQHLKPE